MLLTPCRILFLPFLHRKILFLLFLHYVGSNRDFSAYKLHLIRESRPLKGREEKYPQVSWGKEYLAQRTMWILRIFCRGMEFFTKSMYWYEKFIWAQKYTPPCHPRSLRHTTHKLKSIRLKTGTCPPLLGRDEGTRNPIDAWKYTMKYI